MKILTSTNYSTIVPFHKFFYRQRKNGGRDYFLIDEKEEID
jgi:hypothetical protein